MWTAPVRVWGATAGTLDIRVAHGDDDAEENNSGGAVDLSSTDLELIYDSDNTKNQTIGLRFLSVTIPAGSTITNAYIEFTVDETDGAGPNNLTVWGEKSVNASRFANTANNISTRTTTTASVAWSSIPNWDTVGDEHQAPDLTTIVQEIIGQSG